MVDQDSQNSDAPEDEVIRQLPPAGETRSAGATVTIVYSNGAGTVVVDDYVGFKQGFAERQLSKQGLEVVVRLETVDNESDDGIVLSQSPPRGTRLSPGDRVSLVVGEYAAAARPAGSAADEGRGDSRRSLERARRLAALRSLGRRRTAGGGPRGRRGDDRARRPLDRTTGASWRSSRPPACSTAIVAFPVLHGPFGEDGTVQGLLECLDVPYVGTRRARRGDDDRQADLQAAAGRARDPAGRLLRGG